MILHKIFREISRNSQNFRLFSSISLPDIDTNYYCNKNNVSDIKRNITLRKGVGNIELVIEMYDNFRNMSSVDSSYQTMRENLFRELSHLPNKTHPSVLKYDEEPRLLHEINTKRDFVDHKPLEFSDITRRLNLMRTDKLGNTCGHKSYYFMGALAELEEALIKYTVTMLLKKSYQLVSVPDILPSNVLQSCGMNVNSDRTQIYSLDPLHHGPDLYLSGTSEMSLAGLLMNSVHNKEDLPLKLAAVSRCYRAETSNILEERGIYRVHQFTKVEMFAVTTPDQSEEMLEELRCTQEELFSPLGINMRVLDMPPHELGAPAYRLLALEYRVHQFTKVEMFAVTTPDQSEEMLEEFTQACECIIKLSIRTKYNFEIFKNCKYDIEAWMPGRQNYGEISSCSNCTDYQSRRLHIKYKDFNINKYVHTLNGTACAIPRMLIALVETHQDPKGKIYIPQVLQPFMNGKSYITKNLSVPELKLIKQRK